jgi:putative membrane protein
MITSLTFFSSGFFAATRGYGMMSAPSSSMFMSIIVNWILSAIAIGITAYLLPGVHINGGVTTLLVLSVVLGLINAILKPILKLLTLPITILTLGLFSLVINALMILLASSIVPNFVVDGFWWALLFSIVLSLVNWFFAGLKDK